MKSLSQWPRPEQSGRIAARSFIAPSSRSDLRSSVPAPPPGTRRSCAGRARAYCPSSGGHLVGNRLFCGICAIFRRGRDRVHKLTRHLPYRRCGARISQKLSDSGIFIHMERQQLFCAGTLPLPHPGYHGTNAPPAARSVPVPHTSRPTPRCTRKDCARPRSAQLFLSRPVPAPPLQSPSALFPAVRRAGAVRHIKLHHFPARAVTRVLYVRIHRHRAAVIQHIRRNAHV